MAAASETVITQYLTFTMGDEVFALDIGKVREVLDFTTVTRIPQTPEFMCGVINLRGSVIPVVDLRITFDMPVSRMTVNTCIIISEVTVDGDTPVLGALADSVQEVLDLEVGSIASAPRIGTKLRTEFIKGIGRHNDRFIILLDIDKIFSSDELIMVQASKPDAVS